MERVESGNQQLDRILGGGFVRNSINLIAGAPGSGKTLLTQQLVFANASADRPVVYLSTVSEPLSKILSYLQEQSFANVELIGTQVIYESLSAVLMASPETLPARVTEIIKEHGPAIIVIDSLKAIADLMPDTQTWRRMVFDLASALTAYDTTSFWVGEYNDPTSQGQVEFAVADCILELRREHAAARDDRFLRVLKLRGSGFRTGSHAFVITGDGLSVYPSLLAPTGTKKYAPTPERLLSGITGLDEMIEAGWLRGTASLIAGPSGAGKTMLGLHFLRSGVESGEPGLLVNFQENPVQLQRAMLSLGWSPGDLIGPSKLDIFYSSPIELQIDTIVAEIFRRIEENGIKRVVIDALADVERSSPEAGRFRDYIYALTQHFAERNITSMLCLETPGSLMGQPWSQHEVSYMADNIVLLSMDVGQELRRTIRIVKSRGSAHDGRQRIFDIKRGGFFVGLG